MATLEVHDGQGRVQFIELERNQMILFGTSPSCEIILEGPEIKPVHGRLRLKSGRVKVESSPDAEFVVLNGRRMVSGSIGQGDEITVGPCRIFVLRVDDATETVSRTETRSQDGRTRVMPPPVVPVPSAAVTFQRREPIEGASQDKRSGRRKTGNAVVRGDRGARGPARFGFRRATTGREGGPCISGTRSARQLAAADRPAMDPRGNRGAGPGTDRLFAARPGPDRRLRGPGGDGLLAEIHHRNDHRRSNVQPGPGGVRGRRLSHGDPRPRWVHRVQSRRPTTRQGKGHAGAGQRPAIRLSQRVDLDLGPGSRQPDAGAGRPGRRVPRRADGSGRAGDPDRRGPCRPRAARRRRSGAGPRPSPRCGCTPRSRASPRNRSWSGRGSRRSWPRPARPFASRRSARGPWPRWTWPSRSDRRRGSTRLATTWSTSTPTSPTIAS